MPDKTNNKLLVLAMLKSPIIGLLYWRSSVIASKCLSNVQADMLPLVLKNQRQKQDKPSLVMENLAPVTCFPALVTGLMFSCAWHQYHVLLPLALVACFPRLAPVVSFRALRTSFTSYRVCLLRFLALTGCAFLFL